MTGTERFIWRKTPRRAGFSLITVLLIAMGGMALLGAIAYTFGAFATTSAVVMYEDAKYNALQNEIEKTKAALADKMKDESSAMACNLEKVNALGGLINSGKIIAADALVIYAHDDPDDKPFGMRPDVPWPYGDKAYVLRVRIYDMRYKKAINGGGIGGIEIASMEDFENFGKDEEDYKAFVADLPPAFPPEPESPDPADLNITFSGVYLVRVTLILEGEEQERIETAVIRSVGE